jgi:cation-transporting ATPase E
MAAEAAQGFAARYPGLSSVEAEQRAQAAGTNRFESEATRSYARIFIDNAFPAANVALMAVAFVLIVLGLFIDAFFTGALVLGNIVVGVFQESRAKRQLDRIAVLARSKARVIRDGREHEIDPDDIVQDDIVVIRPGDQVQADGKVLAEDRCSIDESLLTGESDLVRKREGDDVYSGSFCMSGQAVYCCERIGGESFANRITATARAFHVMRTPLQREVGYVMWGMALVVTLISFEVIASFHSIYGRLPLVETTRAAAVIVALVPQGLWVMVTVTYAIAIVRLAPLGTLVQRHNAIESMSHVDLLCLDKTGTITTNALTLEAVHALGIEEAELRRLLGVYCASATISNRTNDAIKASIDAHPVAVIDEVHFDPVRKWSALVVDTPGMQGMYILGAPEVLLGHASSPESDHLLSSWSRRGLRVLLFASRPGLGAVAYRGDEPKLPDDLTLLGFAMLRDQLRTAARETIAEFASAGIVLKIISGDNQETVAALAREAGVPGADHAVSGLDLDADPERLAAAAVDATVFGRIAPAQKASIVEALQRAGHHVAMIGDGVNDVPALKRAHVAISVRSASPVTRSVADIILLDDSFSALPRAFIEGRRIRSGMEAVIRLILTRTFAVALIIVGTAMASSEFPVSPRHTAILSTLTVGIPALFIAAWARPRLTSRYLVPASAPFVVPASILMAAMSVVAYEVALRTVDLPTARTVVTAAGVFAGGLLIPFVDDPPDRWMRLRGLLQPRRTAVLGASTIVLFVIAMLLAPLRHFYELEPIGFEMWLIVIAAVGCWTLCLGTVWRLMARYVPPSGRRGESERLA